MFEFCNFYFELYIFLFYRIVIDVETTLADLVGSDIPPERDNSPNCDNSQTVSAFENCSEFDSFAMIDEDVNSRLEVPLIRTPGAP